MPLATPQPALRASHITLCGMPGQCLADMPRSTMAAICIAFAPVLSTVVGPEGLQETPHLSQSASTVTWLTVPPLPPSAQGTYRVSPTPGVLP